MQEKQTQRGQGGNAGEAWEGEKMKGDLGFPGERGNTFERGREHENASGQEWMNIAGFRFSL